MNFQKHTRRREKCWRKLDLAGRQLTLLKATKTNEDEDLGYLTFPKTQPKASNLRRQQSSSSDDDICDEERRSDAVCDDGARTMFLAIICRFNF